MIQPAAPSTPVTDVDDASDEAVRAAFAAGATEALPVQAMRAQRAKQAARREQLKLDKLIAESVSAQPETVLWYARPGILTLTEVVAAIPGATELAIHSALECHRTKAARKP